MIDVRILKAKIGAETDVKELKLWLEQKALVEYTAWKALPENEKSREAYDKVIARLKLDNETWLEKEEELIKAENKLKVATLIVNTLTETIGAMSRHEDITKEYFMELEAVYFEELLNG